MAQAQVHDLKALKRKTHAWKRNAGAVFNRRLVQWAVPRNDNVTALGAAGHGGRCCKSRCAWWSVVVVVLLGGVVSLLRQLRRDRTPQDRVEAFWTFALTVVVWLCGFGIGELVQQLT